MVDKCCAPGCQNKRGQIKSRVFYRLPKAKHRREKWIEAINRPEHTVNKKGKWPPAANSKHRLCSDHFIAGKQITESVHHANDSDSIQSFKHISNSIDRCSNLYVTNDRNVIIMLDTQQPRDNNLFSVACDDDQTRIFIHFMLFHLV